MEEGGFLPEKVVSPPPAKIGGENGLTTPLPSPQEPAKAINSVPHDDSIQATINSINALFDQASQKYPSTELQKDLAREGISSTTHVQGSIELHSQQQLEIGIPNENASLEEKYGKEYVTFMHKYTIKDGDRQVEVEEPIQVRETKITKEIGGQRKEFTALSLVDRDGERLGLITGEWKVDDQGSQQFYVDESHSATSPEQVKGFALKTMKFPGEVTRYNAKSARSVPGAVRHAIVEVVAQKRVTWYSSPNQSEKGRGMYEHIGGAKFKKPNEPYATGRVNVEQAGNRYVVTPIPQVEGK